MAKNLLVTDQFYFFFELWSLVEEKEGSEV